jgi:chaperonin GroES
MSKNKIRLLGLATIVAATAPFFRRGYSIVGLKATNDRVLILRDEKPTTSPGGIELVSTDTDESGTAIRGKVVAVSSGVDNVCVGDTVFFPPYNGYEVTEGDETYVALKADEILAVVCPD